MQRHRVIYPVSAGTTGLLKQKMLNWANRFGIFCLLDSNAYVSRAGQYECLLGAGAIAVFQPGDANVFEGLQAFHQQHKDWLFGHITYDVKNSLEPTLASNHEGRLLFPAMQFFVPEIVMGIVQGSDTLFIEANDGDAALIYQQLLDTPCQETIDLPKLSFKQRISEQDYLATIAALREHIRNGDCYEINFCNESYCEDVQIDPVNVFQRLNALSPAPFAACYKLADKYLLCASPERYVCQQDNTVWSQPIKGTAPRGIDVVQDEQLKAALYHSEKERAENVMIVDLVRNDLARSCASGSIRVEELFGIYTFPQVHQMISTITGQVKAGLSFSDVLKHSFPMGSMTGAPKVKVMELIERYEASRRELFSGTVGYISPQGDMDFNVVIRSLFYNAASRYLSYQTGGAITWDSDPQSEWEELRLKGAAMERLFSGKNV